MKLRFDITQQTDLNRVKQIITEKIKLNSDFDIYLQNFHVLFYYNKIDYLYEIIIEDLIRDTLQIKYTTKINPLTDIRFENVSDVTNLFDSNSIFPDIGRFSAITFTREQMVDRLFVIINILNRIHKLKIFI